MYQVEFGPRAARNQAVDAAYSHQFLHVTPAHVVHEILAGDEYRF